MIALEIAQQLKQAGAEVVMLAMIDTLSPLAARAKVSPLKKIWLLRHWSLKFALEYPERRRNGQRERASLSTAMQLLSTGNTLTPELASVYLFSHFVTVQACYRTPLYDGPLVLFRAQDGFTPYLNGGPQLGWQTHLRGDIRVVEIPGSHVSMLSEPGLSRLARGLQQALAWADAPTELASGLDAPVDGGCFREKNVAA